MIGTNELLKLVKEKNLVENLLDRELENPEGAGFDLRISAVYKLKEGEAFLGAEERFTPETELIASEGSAKEVVLEPGEFVLVKTAEKVNLPPDIAAIFRPRSTLQRSGVALYTATASPGYSGELTFAMHNFGKNRFRLEIGARVAHILFFYTSENHSTYRGQWQNGRVSTEGSKEEQV